MGAQSSRSDATESGEQTKGEKPVDVRVDTAQEDDDEPDEW